MWLQLTFFPIEDKDELERLRALLSPFMKNVQKCGVFNGSRYAAGRERIMNDIIKTASSDVNKRLLDGLNRVMIRPENETINAEHDRLRAMNIRLNNSIK